MRFSQRIGLRPVKTELQVGSIDSSLRNRLWNVYLEDFIAVVRKNNYNGEQHLQSIFKILWTEFFGYRIDHMPAYSDGQTYVKGILDQVTEWFFKKADWGEVYDFIEFFAFFDDKGLNTNFIKACNSALEREVSGYRIVNGIIAQITTEEETSTIEEVLTIPDKHKSVKTHIETALKFLSDRISPDYRNSVKESISAVEAYCKIVVDDDKASLGKALAIIERKFKLHASLKEAYNKLYGYTSDADGVRHSLLEDGVPIEFEDAKFMLVSCSAFINYLNTKLNK